ncbi:hypothetical protein L2Y96_12875 [Luteibacter aegosomaticola]|uniref:hypothetical protein n=1 Tax=Luteibacter aegosomaticola TaxID=2911538 RepID=UPI001FFB51DB|nr:hypothetical protein [Luteibacter aegosomaticola]UPG88314.1 hypothetical protein L2Y96_12875 [Luteibacter aegosomaticola]
MRILANFLFWLLPALIVIALWKSGRISVSTSVPEWLSSLLEGILDVPAIAFVILVSGALFCLLRLNWRTRPLARVVAEEVSRVLYVAATYVSVAVIFIVLAGLSHRGDVANALVVAPCCIGFGLLAAWAAHRFT